MYFQRNFFSKTIVLIAVFCAVILDSPKSFALTKFLDFNLQNIRIPGHFFPDLRTAMEAHKLRVLHFGMALIDDADFLEKFPQFKEINVDHLFEILRDHDFSKTHSQKAIDLLEEIHNTGKPYEAMAPDQRASFLKRLQTLVNEPDDRVTKHTLRKLGYYKWKNSADRMAKTKQIKLLLDAQEIVDKSDRFLHYSVLHRFKKLLRIPDSEFHKVIISTRKYYRLKQINQFSHLDKIFSYVEENKKKLYKTSAGPFKLSRYAALAQSANRDATKTLGLFDEIVDQLKNRVKNRDSVRSRIRRRKLYRRNRKPSKVREIERRSKRFKSEKPKAPKPSSKILKRLGVIGMAATVGPSVIKPGNSAYLLNVADSVMLSTLPGSDLGTDNGSCDRIDPIANVLNLPLHVAQKIRSNCPSSERELLPLAPMIKTIDSCPDSRSKSQLLSLTLKGQHQDSFLNSYNLEYKVHIRLDLEQNLESVDLRVRAPMTSSLGSDRWQKVLIEYKQGRPGSATYFKFNENLKKNNWQPTYSQSLKTFDKHKPFDPSNFHQRILSTHGQTLLKHLSFKYDHLATERPKLEDSQFLRRILECCEKASCKSVFTPSKASGQETGPPVRERSSDSNTPSAL